MKPGLKKNLMLLVVTILIVFVVSEGAMRFYFNAKGRTIGINEEEVCDRRTYRASLGENIPTGRFQIGFPIHYEYSPYSGIRPRANWRDGNDMLKITNDDGTEREFVYYVDHTNSQHIRRLEDIPPKDDDKIRIAIFGDSFTWGNEAPLKFAYPSILEELIPNSEVLNFGVEGTGTDVMYTRWKYEALQYDPDVIIFGIFVGDVRRAFPCIHKPKFRRVGNKLKIENFPPPTYEQIAKTYQEPKIESYLIKNILYNIKYLRGVERVQSEEGFEILDLILDEVQERAERDDTLFAVLIIEQGNDEGVSDVLLWTTQRLKEMLDEKDILYVSQGKIFGKEKYSPTKYRDGSTDYLKEIPITFPRGYGGGHFLPEGYAYLAQGLKNMLEEEKAIEKQKDYNFLWDHKSDILYLQNKDDESDIKTIIPYEELS